jgi:hypothetical protein
MDTWLEREFPTVEFERFADDAVLHCVTERQARQVRDGLAERLDSCACTPTKPRSSTVGTTDGVAPLSTPRHVLPVGFENSVSCRELRFHCGITIGAGSILGCWCRFSTGQSERCLARWATPSVSRVRSNSMMAPAGRVPARAAEGAAGGGPAGSAPGSLRVRPGRWTGRNNPQSGRAGSADEVMRDRVGPQSGSTAIIQRPSGAPPVSQHGIVLGGSV